MSSSERYLFSVIRWKHELGKLCATRTKGVIGKKEEPAADTRLRMSYGVAGGCLYSLGSSE